MDIHHLRSFVIVAQYLSFTEAAKRLFIGQSALSRQIADLEDELGVDLFIRHHRSLELTAAGKTLLKEGKNLINQVAEVIEKTRQAQQGIRGSLKIGCFGIESAFLPQALKRFRSLYPQISIDICVLTLKMIKDALEREELDLGFTVFLGNECKSNGFMRRLIHRTPLCFLLPNGHPYSGKTSLDISALAQDPFILLSEDECPEGFDWFMNFCESRGFVPNIISKTTRMESVIWQIEAGVGISFISRDPALFGLINHNICLVDMEGEDAYNNITATWKREHRNPAIPLFLKVLENLQLPNNAKTWPMPSCKHA
ncbi:HTH-type transcriptional regulator HdfR [Sporomusa carbonis]|uniref:LysR family transcriptional regulator n=1 Tax=Sporomusa carbonis TaxID=3076075 RepID=UPI003A744881